MSFIKGPDSDVVCYTKPLDSLKHWNDHFFWVDSFACPASFSWHTGKNVSEDPFPKSTEFSADDYAVLVAHPAPFQKFSEPFLCLIGMSCNYMLKGQIEEFQDVQMNIVNDKVAQLDVDLLEMALHQEEKFYPYLFNTISGRRWLLTHGLKLAVIKCLNSQEYLSALEEAIIRSIKKGMQDGLSVNIDRGKAVRKLADVVAYNPAAEANYNSTVQRLCEVDFSLHAELKSHKDASVEDIMNLLRLEGPLADALGISGLQPHRECCSEVSALIDVWTPLVDPLFVKNLMAEADTSDSMPATTAITTALSTTFASASSVPLITIEYYKIMGTDGLEDS
nr:transposase (putative), gypsy type [Tanacetum cinerariifolium]